MSQIDLTARALARCLEFVCGRHYELTGKMVDYKGTISIRKVNQIIRVSVISWLDEKHTYYYFRHTCYPDRDDFHPLDPKNPDDLKILRENLSGQ